MNSSFNISKNFIFYNFKNTRLFSNYMHRHVNDHYVKESKNLNYRSRSAFKLIEINKKFNLMNKNQNILDIGAAPGGWCQVMKELSKNSVIIGVDLLKIEPLNGIHFLQGDINSVEILNKINLLVKDLKFDLIVSDACPELSGIKNRDIILSNNLVIKIIDFSYKLLKPGGNLVLKAFDSDELSKIYQNTLKKFEKISKFKPLSSRKESSELYLVCLNKI